MTGFLKKNFLQIFKNSSLAISILLWKCSFHVTYFMWASVIELYVSFRNKKQSRKINQLIKCPKAFDCNNPVIENWFERNLIDHDLRNANLISFYLLWLLIVLNREQFLSKDTNAAKNNLVFDMNVIYW